MTPPLRRFVIGKARKPRRPKASPENYPAPFRALEAIDAGVLDAMPQGLDLEARIVGELVPTRTSEEPLWLFKSQSALKTGPPEGSSPFRARCAVRRCSGRGSWGEACAQLIADKGGSPVRLKDLRGDALLTALRQASEDLARAGGPQEDSRLRRDAPAGSEFIAPTTDDSGFTKVDIVLEAWSKTSK